MYGFPEDTSPFCRGMFCGAHLAKYSEVVEGIYRILRSSLYKNYSLSRFDVGKWIQENKQDIPVSWFGIAKKNLETCGRDSCPLHDAGELDIYVSYCATNNCDLPHYDVFPANTDLSVILSILVKV